MSTLSISFFFVLRKCIQTAVRERNVGFSSSRSNMLSRNII
uniref:Uncharacterized protein n=1 Tax=Arundo donax TaxID=35708 RepID=A0A0A8Y1P4_ARUDO